MFYIAIPPKPASLYTTFPVQGPQEVTLLSLFHEHHFRLFYPAGRGGWRDLVDFIIVVGFLSCRKGGGGICRLIFHNVIVAPESWTSLLISLTNFLFCSLVVVIIKTNYQRKIVLKMIQFPLKKWMMKSLRCYQKKNGDVLKFIQIAKLDYLNHPGLTWLSSPSNCKLAGSGTLNKQKPSQC